VHGRIWSRFPVVSLRISAAAGAAACELFHKGFVPLHKELTKTLILPLFVHLMFSYHPTILTATVLNSGGVGGQWSFTSLTASWGAFFATLFVALALLFGRRAPAIPLLIVAAFGWTLQISHAALHRPMAFGLLVIAEVWIWFRGGATSHRLY
jgi:hypothetical protein